MCFTVSIIPRGKEMAAQEYFESLPIFRDQHIDVPELPFYYLVNGFSHPKLAVARHDGVFLHEWGLIPWWVKDETSAKEMQDRTLNAVGETAFEKASFKNSVASKRCLLPVSGYYEWRDVKGVKYPYFVQSTEREYFSLGAIYETWTNKETGEMHDTFSIITTAANPLMEKIHNLKKRMPLMIPVADEMKWLDPELEKEQVKKLIRPFPEEKMSAYTISREANSARNNRNVPEILNKVEYSELDALDNTLF